MLTHPKKFTIVSIVDDSQVVLSQDSGEPAGPLIQYWWTTKTKTPYLTGDVDVDWSGPYISEEAAINSVHRDDPDAEVTILPWHLDRQDEPLQFAPARTYDFELLVTMPLDEVSERALCGGKELSSERAELIDALQYRIGLERPEARHFLVNLVDYDFAQLAGRLFREQGVASFTMPLIVHVRSEKAMSLAVLKQELRPVVTLEEFYPGKVRANLLVPSVF